MDLTIREWERITRTPVLVFAVVAMADEDVSDDERSAFADMWIPRLRDFEVSQLDHDRSVYQDALSAAASRWAGIAKLGEQAILEELQGAITLLNERLPERPATAWKNALRRLGIDIAEASGGFLGITDPIDVEEHRVLRLIFRMLSAPAR